MVAFHQESQRVAVGGVGSFMILDIRTGEALYIRTSSSIFAAEFSPQGKALVTYGSNNKICLWIVEGTLRSLRLSSAHRTAEATFTPPSSITVPTQPERGMSVFWERPGIIVLQLSGREHVYKVSVNKNL